MTIDTPPSCERCGFIQEPYLDNPHVGDLNGETVCVDCRKEELYEETVLSEREAHVFATKELIGGTHNDISDKLKVEKSTIDEYSRRINDKVAKAERTIEIVNGEMD